MSDAMTSSWSQALTTRATLANISYPHTTVFSQALDELSLCYRKAQSGYLVDFLDSDDGEAMCVVHAHTARCACNSKLLACAVKQ